MTTSICPQCKMTRNVVHAMGTIQCCVCYHVWKDQGKEEFDELFPGLFSKK